MPARKRRLSDRLLLTDMESGGFELRLIRSDKSVREAQLFRVRDDAMAEVRRQVSKYVAHGWVIDGDRRSPRPAIIVHQTTAIVHVPSVPTSDKPLVGERVTGCRKKQELTSLRGLLFTGIRRPSLMRPMMLKEKRSARSMSHAKKRT